MMKFVTGEVQVAAALTAQLHKVIMQLGLDDGGWGTAILLWPMADPTGSDDFAGDPAEMSAAHKWKKAMTELTPKPNQRDRWPRETDDGDEEKTEGKGKGRGGRKSWPKVGGVTPS